MIKERQKYDREFKQKAVELYFARDNTKEIAEEAGIPAQTLPLFNRVYSDPNPAKMRGAASARRHTFVPK